MKGFFTCLLFHLCLFGAAQTNAGSKEIDITNIDYKTIEQIFYNKLNELRKEKNAGALTTDPILKLAANDQSAYMSAKHLVTHDQELTDKATPQLRVFFYKGTHDRVGENCIKVLLKTPMKVKYSKNMVTANTIEDAAEALFLGWKNSPGHYKNMIEPGYDVGGLGFYFQKDSNILYCAQVFSALPYTPKPGLESPANAFGVKVPDKKICSCMATKEARDAQSAMRLVRGIDTIYLESENLKALKNFFNKPGDAYYVDLVIREQFLCANNNLLHGSELYDGCMQKPVLFKDLFKTNRASGNNFFAPICAIPPKIKKYKYDINHGIVKEGRGCSYSWSVLVGGENLKLLPLFPKWFQNPKLEIQPDTFKGFLDFQIPFGRGITKMNSKTVEDITSKLKIYKPFIKQVQIKTFSSVEGSTAGNLKLQQARATEINLVVQNVTGLKAATEIESKENWDDFMNQIENSKFLWMKNLSHEKIKINLQNKKTLDSMDYLLKKTRIARLRIEIETVVDENSSPYLLLAAYKRSIEKGDSLKAFACQNKLLKAIFGYQLKNSDVTDVAIPFTKKYIHLWTNYVALSTFDPDMFYSYQTRETAIKAYHLDTTFAPMQFNFCIMALKYLAEFNDSLIPAKRLEEKMYECYKMVEPGDTALVNHMLLNFNILTAFNHYERHEFDKVDRPLKYIKSYFEQQKVTEEEAVKLALLFNLYGRFTWTEEVLKPFMKEGSTHEDLVFTYVSTYAGLHETTEQDKVWVEYLQRAKKINPKRFFDWIDKSCFQLLRRSEIKKEFCGLKF